MFIQVIFSALIIFLFILPIVYAVRINEVELNPEGADSGNEWIEFYSDNFVSMDGWIVENARGKTMNLSGVIEEYLIIKTPYNFLVNDKQKLGLFNDKNELIDETEIISDNSNDERSWQYCDSGWIFKNASREMGNRCDEEQIIEEQEESSKEQEPSHKEAIKLGKDLRSWKSKTQYIKEYSILGFTLFLIVILILIWQRKI